MQDIRTKWAARLAAAGLFCLSFAGAKPAFAQDSSGQGVRVGLTYGLGTRPGVLVLPSGHSGADSIRAIIQRDIDFDDRATVITMDDERARALVPADGELNFPLYSKLGAVFVIYPRNTPQGLVVTVYEVAKKKAMQTRTYTMPDDTFGPAWRMMLHGISDQIGFWVFGTPGSASTRILYVYQANVWMIDADGANPRKLTSGSLDLSPAWHPSGTMFAYSGYSGRGTGSQIAIRNLATGETHWKSSSARGLNITPAFSADGRSIAYAHGEDANTHLMIAGASDDSPARRLTVGNSINTSPAFSPDGRQITYMSGRAGHPEVYIMDTDGSNSQLLTEFAYGESNYRASPDWSPDGRSIAYQTRISGAFQIMSIDLRDKSTKQYTSDGENEDPSWAPDSRHLVFSSTRSGARQLWVIDVASGRMRQITKQGGAKLPAWSPLLKRP